MELKNVVCIVNDEVITKKTAMMMYGRMKELGYEVNDDMTLLEVVQKFFEINGVTDKIPQELRK